jgi:hypothetical protein
MDRRFDMRDYTMNGVPVRKMSMDDIIEILANPEILEINCDGGHPNAVERVLERLRIELGIRRILGEAH